jgi:serine/threonine protein kinase
MENVLTKNKPFNYKLIKKVGSGAFGDVYKGESIIHLGEYYAIKSEEPDADKKDRLENEYNYYRDLNNNPDHNGIPEVYWYGKTDLKIPPSKEKPFEETLPKNVLVMDYLGPSLEKLFHYLHHNFSLKTILMIGIQSIERLQFIHNNGIIHRDIKPDNFLIGSNNATKSTIYIVDFGLSKKYIDLTNYEFNPFKNTRTFTGTYRFCSLRSHKRLEQSRRDDLESLGYMLVYFFKGELPWQGIKDDPKKKENRSNLIFKVKKNLSIDDLCSGCPTFMTEYLKYCRMLKYTEVPNYVMLKSLFINAMNENKYALDYNYDWCSI